MKIALGVIASLYVAAVIGREVAAHTGSVGVGIAVATLGVFGVLFLLLNAVNGDRD